MTKLSPAQQVSYDALEKSLTVGNFVVVRGKSGRGKTTILRKLHAEHDSKFLDTREYLDEISLKDPFQMEEVLGA